MPPKEWQKRKVAGLLACGWTHEQAAAHVGIHPQSIRRWLAQTPGYRDMVERQRARMLEHLRERMIGNVVVAADLQRDVLAGELDYDSSAWKEGSHLLYTALKGGLQGILDSAPSSPEGPPKLEGPPPRVIDEADS